MRKILISAVASLVCLAAGAQDYKSLYTKYSDNDKITSVYVSPAMFKLIGKVPEVRLNEGDVDLAPMIKSMTGFYMLQTEDQELGDKIAKDLKRIVDGKRMELMMEVNDKGQKVKVFSIGDKDFIKSMVLTLAKGPEKMFVSIDGLMRRSELEEAIGQAAGQLFD